MREISYLHMQLRNYPAFVESRLNLLKVQPHLRMNWVALATAHHLAGSLEQAVRVLERYEETLRVSRTWRSEGTSSRLWRILSSWLCAKLASVALPATLVWHRAALHILTAGLIGRPCALVRALRGASLPRLYPL